jgi:hypothetical protein
MMVVNIALIELTTSPNKLWSNYLSNNESVKFFEDIQREVFSFLLKISNGMNEQKEHS